MKLSFGWRLLGWVRWMSITKPAYFLLVLLMLLIIPPVVAFKLITFKSTAFLISAVWLVLILFVNGLAIGHLAISKKNWHLLAYCVQQVIKKDEGKRRPGEVLIQCAKVRNDGSEIIHWLMLLENVWFWSKVEARKTKRMDQLRKELTDLKPIMIGAPWKYQDAEFKLNATVKQWKRACNELKTSAEDLWNFEHSL